MKEEKKIKLSPLFLFFSIFDEFSNLSAESTGNAFMPTYLNSANKYRKYAIGISIKALTFKQQKHLRLLACASSYNFPDFHLCL